VPVVSPRDPDTVYTANTFVQSTDGAGRGCPSRARRAATDYQNLWISPVRHEHHAVARNQGAVVTLNGGETWSSWYTPNAQLYHVNTDNDFPYRVCSGQQESGRLRVEPRQRRAITFPNGSRCGEEYGYAVPDPQDPNRVGAAR